MAFIFSGFPNQTNTGIPEGVTLRPSGSLVITQAGTVIDGLDITGKIEILAPNVTIQNSRITTTDWAAIWIKPGTDGVVVKDSEISNYGDGANQSNGIAGEGTFLRNDIFHVENGINVFGPSLIQGNYIHDMESNGAPHYDGIEINGGRDVTVRHNTIINDHGQTSAVMINNDFAPVDNIVVDDNFLVGGGYTVYSDSRFDGGPTTGVNFINNVLGKGYWGYAAFWENTPTWSSNIDMDSYRYVSSNGSLSGVAPGGIIGTSASNALSGTSGVDTIFGLGGNDVIEGRAGADTIDGGNGTDTISYAGSSAGVSVNLGTGRGSGGDAAGDVLASIENLTGSRHHDILVGNDAANTLHDGGTAADTMRGLGGNDTYRVYNSGDVIVEASSQVGTDRVAAAVDYQLGAGVSVEQLMTNGSAGTSSIDLTGNEFVQAITGNAGSNIIDGKGGGDRLSGSSGKDFFVFSTALSASNVDIITDFSAAADTIRLENAIFAALSTTGTLATSAFKNLKLGAIDANDHILYNPDTGNLAYDPDGAGGAAAIKFANIANHVVLTAADFVVI